MPRSHKEVEILLTKLEQCLREAKLWSSSRPSAKALQSSQPFALDTMPFEQWLQYIFIPKMSEIVNNKITLPTALKLLPMAEERFGVSVDMGLDIKSGHSNLIKVIKHIDIFFGLS